MYIPELETVDEDFITFMQKWNIPGGSAALVKDGRLVYSRAFGYAESNITTKPSHLFRIASLSKPITSIAVMKLIQEGKLHMEDEIFGTKGILNDSIYLNIPDPRVLQITLKELLQHSGGWDRETSPLGDPMFNPDGIAQAMNIAAPADQISIIRYVLQKSLDFTPGTAYAYSNFGYNVLGRVIEKVTGELYEEYVKNNILYPLQIFDLDLAKNYYEERNENEVQYYLDPLNSPLMLSSDSQDWNPSACGGFNIEAMDAHGGWLASASSLARLLTAVDGFESQPDILNKDILLLMSSPSATNPSYANGWFVNSQGNWWHTGSLPGTSAMLARLNNGIIWVILFNKRSDEINYFSELDQLMWTALSKIKVWPDHDLFSTIQTGISAGISPVHIDVFPNPALHFSTITFKLTQTSKVKIEIFNEYGISMAKITDAIYSEGEHQFLWDCIGLNKGIYICKIQIGEFPTIKKIIVN
jgi:CubicO group peptidase (beta-lactamase class C family)